MNKKILGAIIALSAIAITGCRKDLNGDYRAGFQLVPSNAAKLKIIYASAYLTNPSVQLKVDGQRVSNLIKGRTPFPGGGLNTTGSNFPDYLALDKGTKSFSISIPKAGTETDSIVLFNSNVDLAENASYTFNVSDTGVNTKTRLIKDTLTNTSAAVIKYHFVNLIPNTPLLNLYYGTTLVASDVPYNSEGISFTMPVPTTTLAWTVREPGSSTTLATYSSGSSIVGSRILTVFAMGYKGQSSTNLKPYVCFAFNK